MITMLSCGDTKSFKSENVFYVPGNDVACLYVYMQHVYFIFRAYVILLVFKFHGILLPLHKNMDVSWGPFY